MYGENTAWLHAMHAVTVVPTADFVLASTFMALNALRIQTTSVLPLHSCSMPCTLLMLMVLRTLLNARLRYVTWVEMICHSGLIEVLPGLEL